jgi:two-component system, LytTR family, response regulator
MTAIALDDEPAALEILIRHAAKVPFIDLKRTFFSAAEALSYLHENTVDILFLDIQMPDILGTDFAQLVQKPRTQVIFITAHPDYAVAGFTLKALDYLLKPLDFGRFLQACNRALEQQTRQRGESGHIFVKDGYDWVRVVFDNIQYIQSDTNLLFIHEQNRQISTRMTVTDMLELLPSDRFLRVHKSYIVCLDAIQKIERHQLQVGDVVIPLAGNYRETLEERLLKKTKLG